MVGSLVSSNQHHRISTWHGRSSGAEGKLGSCAGCAVQLIGFSGNSPNAAEKTHVPQSRIYRTGRQHRSPGKDVVSSSTRKRGVVPVHPVLNITRRLRKARLGGCAWHDRCGRIRKCPATCSGSTAGASHNCPPAACRSGQSLTGPVGVRRNSGTSGTQSASDAARPSHPDSADPANDAPPSRAPGVPPARARGATRPDTLRSLPRRQHPTAGSTGRRFRLCGQCRGPGTFPFRRADRATTLSSTGCATSTGKHRRSTRTRVSAWPWLRSTTSITSRISTIRRTPNTISSIRSSASTLAITGSSPPAAISAPGT